MDCREVDDVLAGAVLGALNPDEQTAVDQHLASCDQHPQIRGFQRVADELAASVKAVPPRAEVKHKLMARVYRDVEPRTAKFAWRGAWGWAVAAVMAAIAAGFGVRDYVASSQLASAPAQWQLQPSVAGVQTTGTLVYLPRERTATLTLRQLPPLPLGEVFEIWLIKGGAAQPAGVFRPLGETTASVIVKGQPLGYEAVAVTREPAPNGSAAPTTAPFVSGSLR
ncbi:MAG: anti-sigma factor [Chloroflexota bacterium]|nr:anti-sigma factor [Chloroflexota bacterium]